MRIMVDYIEEKKNYFFLAEKKMICAKSRLKIDYELIEKNQFRRSAQPLAAEKKKGKNRFFRNDYARFG